MIENTNVPVREEELGIFGQFKSKKFWQDFLRLIIQEAITMFLISLGTSLLHIGRKGKNKEIKSDIGGSDLANKAFGNYSGNYSPSYSETRYPIAKTDDFPGI